MREEKGARKRADPIGKASGNLEKALETMSRRLLTQIKEGETPGKELGELAKVMKQAVEIRQELPNLIIDRQPTDAGIKHQHGGTWIRRCSCQTRCIPVLQFGSHKLSRNLYRTGWLFYHEL